MTPTCDLAVVVVSHQSAATLDDCLQRLRACDGVAAIRVVDNASADGTLEIAQRHAISDARVRFIANPDNPGFAVACNQGADDALQAPAIAWVAFVNPDALVGPDTLARLRALAVQAGGDVLLGVDLVDEAGVRDAAARRRDPDFAAMLRGAAGGAARASMAVAPDDSRALQDVQAISGALMLLPRGLYTRLAGFDTGYRLHAEDLDLCRRARLAGARVAVANHVRVVHVRGVSSRSRPIFVEWHKHRGLWRYYCTFDAARHGGALRAAVFAALVLRFPLAAARAWVRARQH